MSSFEGLVKLLHEKGTSFSTHIERVKRLNDELQAKAAAFLSAIDSLKGSMMVDTATPKCAICFTRPRERCFVPCGHVVCSNCAQRANQRNPPRCFTCRQPVQDTIRIFL